MNKYSRYYTTKQRRSYDCGITCALNILRYYSVHVSRSDLQDILADKAIRKEGASVFDLVQILEKYGIYAQGIRCDMKYLVKHARREFPTILLVEIVPQKFHYIVVYGIDKGNIIIADPCIWVPRIRRIPIGRFAKMYGWNGIVIQTEYPLKNTECPRGLVKSPF